MSVQSVQNQIAGVQREIEALQRRLTRKSKDEATKTGRTAQVNRSITKNTSVSSLQGKQRQIDSLNNDIVRLQRDKADLTKRIGDKTARLHKLQQDLYKEQEREQKKFQDSLKRKEREDHQRQQELLNTLHHAAHGGEQAPTPARGSRPEYDAFICHASEDKEDLVRLLAQELITRGLTIWYDEFQLKVGDSLRRSIDAGLARSRFGIVVLSPSFFAKNWPQYELDGLVAKEMTGGKVILPLWHKVSKNEVIQYSPALADKVALNTATATIEELAQELADAMKDV